MVETSCHAYVLPHTPLLLILAYFDNQMHSNALYVCIRVFVI